MTEFTRGPKVAVVLACLAYAAGLFLVSQHVTRGIAYARAAHEAKSVARVVRGGATQLPLTVRPLLAAGPVARVRTDLTNAFGREVERIGVEDRTLVIGGFALKAVVLPVKDADEWDIVGAVAMGVDPWAGSLIPALVCALAALLAMAQAMLAIRRLAHGEIVDGHVGVAGAALALLLGAAALIVRARLELLRAAQAMDAATDQRFDPTALPLPEATPAVLMLAGVGIAATGALLASVWFTSARRSLQRRRATAAAWSFLAPSAVHLAALTLAPLVFTLFVSFHDWDLLGGSNRFVGLANYREMFGDPLFWNALRNTAVYSLYVPVTMALALGAALALDRPSRAVRVLRALVFLPTVVSFAAIAVVWQWMFNADYGLLNYVLRAVGLEGVDWLSDPRTALIAVMIVSAWVQIGYQMVIYLAGLQSIPATYYEAATLDGAGPWQRFREITLPLLRPVSVYLFVTGIIWSFQVFTLVYVMTEGGPVHATDVLVYRIYQNAWEFRRMGYASAMSWFLFALLLVLTLAQWKVINRRVDHAA
jgi:ABC-type sugar transport system permease subunit